MIFRKNDYSSIAKERLKLMMETDSLEYGSCDLSQLKKEIAGLMERHFELPADRFEIRITLKPEQKRV